MGDSWLKMSGAIHRQVETAARETLRKLAARAEAWGYPVFTQPPTDTDHERFAEIIKQVTSRYVIEGDTITEKLTLEDGTILSVQWDRDGVKVNVEIPENGQ